MTRRRALPIRDATPRLGDGERFVRPGELPKTIQPIKAIRPALTTGLPEDFVQFREAEFMGYARDERSALERRAVPIEEVYGSVHERILWKALVKRGIPFDFQSSLLGPRFEAGAIVSDFVLLDRPQILNPLGEIWHRGLDAETRDLLQVDILNANGWEVHLIPDFVIEEEELMDDWMRRHIDVPVVRPVTPEMLAMLGIGAIRAMPTLLGVPLRN